LHLVADYNYTQVIVQTSMQDLPIVNKIAF